MEYECDKCEDTGFLIKGHSFNDSKFCDCYEGNAVFEANADGEAAASYECDSHWFDGE